MAQKSRKANGQGHTYKNGNSYRTVIQCNGRTITASAKTFQESRRIAKEKLLALPRSVTGTSLKLNKVLLSEFLLDWLNSEHKNHIAHSTYKRYLSLAKNHINPGLGNYHLQDLTPKLITGLLNSMRESGQGSRSQQQARALLSITLRAAEDQELIQINPIHKVRNPQNKSNEIHPLNLEEVKRLLKTYKDTYMGARLHIALICGLRQGEALGLTWKNVNFDERTIYIEKQIQLIDGVPIFTSLKTKRSERKLALTSETLSALLKQHAIVQELKIGAGESWQEWDLVFPREDGSPRSPMADYDKWQNALRLCGIKPRRLHDARHTAATLMYSSNIGIETISRALGHSSSAITSRLYVHSAEEPLRNAADVLGVILRS